MDSSELDDSQKEILTQFQAITQSDDVDAAVNRLVHYDWSLQRAVDSVYDPNNSHDATRETLEHEVASSAHGETPSSSSPPAPAPHLTSRRPHIGLLAVIAWPFGFAWNMTWAILSFVMRFTSHPTITHSNSSQQQRQDPRLLAERFRREFRRKYGETHIDLYQGGYSQALEAARRDLRFLLVILQSDEHDDTEGFCRNTLTSRDLIDYIEQHNVLVWGGNVCETEAFQVAGTLQATTYPFMAIIALQQQAGGSNSLRMAVVDRIEGPVSSATAIQRLERATRRHSAGMNRLRMEREQREVERRLRQEQDRAYRESLKADQEKERQAQEARAAAMKAEEELQQAEQARLELAEKRQQYIRYLCCTLADEPDDRYTGQIVKLNFRLADGTRVVRKFRGDETLEALYRFVEAYPLLKEEKHVQRVEAPKEYAHKYSFTVISPYPRIRYESSITTPLTEVKSLWPTATLIVDADDDDDDESEE